MDNHLVDQAVKEFEKQLQGVIYQHIFLNHRDCICSNSCYIGVIINSPPGYPWHKGDDISPTSFICVIKQWWYRRFIFEKCWASTRRHAYATCYNSSRLLNDVVYIHFHLAENIVLAPSASPLINDDWFLPLPAKSVDLSSLIPCLSPTALKTWQYFQFYNQSYFLKRSELRAWLPNPAIATMCYMFGLDSHLSLSFPVNPTRNDGPSTITPKLNQLFSQKNIRLLKLWRPHLSQITSILTHYVSLAIHTMPEWGVFVDKTYLFPL